jgi:di/tricarboxylate transporter
MVEATLGHASPLIGRTIDEAAFSKEYDAVLLSVHRRGSQFEAGAPAEAVLPGDCLLLMTAAPFVQRYTEDSAFALVRHATEYR